MNKACHDGSTQEAHIKVMENLRNKVSVCTDTYNQNHSSNVMFKVFLDYMELVLVILSFVKVTRQGNWDLHVAALENLVKFFFALDNLMYARMVPLYLSEMKPILKFI